MRCLAVLLLLTFAAALPAAAADYSQRAPATDVALPSSPGLPACDDPRVLGNILDRQHWAEANTWKDGILIQSIGDIRQKYSTTMFSSAVEHRHCLASADFGDNRGDQLVYVISREMGFAGVSWYVDFCMPNHDPYRVYDADCRVLR